MVGLATRSCRFRQTRVGIAMDESYVTLGRHLLPLGVAPFPCLPRVRSLMLGCIPARSVGGVASLICKVEIIIIVVIKVMRTH